VATSVGGTRRRVTIQDIANETGVHKSTVSLALNNLPGVSELKRSEIKATAEKLGWYPSSSARVLFGTRTNVVGLIVRRDPKAFAADSFFPRFVYGIAAVLDAHEMSMQLALIGPDPDHVRGLELYRRWWGEGRVDGFVLTDPEVRDPRVKLIQEIGAPAVMAERRSSADNIAAIRPDHDQTATLVINHLVDRGHTKVAAILGPQNYLGPRGMASALQRSAKKRGVEIVTIAFADFTVEGGMTSTQRILLAHPSTTAIITANDLVALGSNRAFDASGVNAADRPALISLADSNLCEHVGGGITAVAHGLDERGSAFASALIELIVSGKAPADVAGVAPPMLIDRGSVRINAG
jgi:DNA-binding LacI/PurR family transcriptional regulator